MGRIQPSAHGDPDIVIRQREFIVFFFQHLEQPFRGNEQMRGSRSGCSSRGGL
jgi:hypothetical protein